MPNDRFGYGRVHAFDALVSSNLPPITITASDDEICTNEALVVTAPAGYDHYLWSNGTTGNPSTYSGPGPVSVVASTSTGCAHSNGLTFFVHVAPPTPTITADGTELTSSSGPAYQWYLNGNPIGGANGMVYTATVSGNYTVEITDLNGCSATSDPEAVVISGIGDVHGNGFAVWPSPANDLLSVRIPAGSGTVRIRVADASGRVVIDQRGAYASQVDLPLGTLPAGSYNLRVEQGDAKWETRFVKVP